MLHALQVLPLSESKTKVIMEYYVHPSKVRSLSGNCL